MVYFSRDLDDSLVGLVEKRVDFSIGVKREERQVEWFKSFKLWIILILLFERKKNLEMELKNINYLLS